MVPSLFKLLFILLQITTSISEQTCFRSIEVPAGEDIRITNTDIPQKEPNGTECYINITTTTNHLLKINCNLEDKYGHCENYFTIIRNGNTSDRDVSCLPFTISAKKITLRNRITRINGTVRFSCDIRSYKNCTCGEIPANLENDEPNIEGRIVGGVGATKGEFPSIAALFLMNNYGKWTLECAATIISRRVLLTASHCIFYEPIRYRVAVGGYDPEKNNSTIFYGIIKAKKHEGGWYIDDVALLVTEKSIEFSNEIGPACLPFNITINDLIGRTVTAAGWGDLRLGGPEATKLMKVDLDITDGEDCGDTYPTNYNREKHICTFTPNKDTCQGDSGGPLYYIKNNHYYVVGIVNRGYGCAKSPGLNMNVNHYLKWIMDNVEDDKICEM